MSNTKVNLVIFPFHDWKVSESTGFRTRDAHLMQEFEKNENIAMILIVDRPISLPEILLKKRCWRVKDGKKIFRTVGKSLTQVSDKIYVLDIFSFELLNPIILRRRWWDYVFKKSSIIKTIKETIAHLNFTNIVLFIWSPFSTGVIGNLNESLIVFDALDNWVKHPDAQNARKQASLGYKTVKERADLIFTNSQALKDFMENPRKNVLFIPNGVDTTFFQPNHNREYPADIRQIQRPIIGFAGKMSKRINTDLVSFLATEMPDVSFVFIGPILNKKWIRPLFRRQNIHFLGDKHYSFLPKYINSFDLCIIPYNVGALDVDGDPIKLYEYLACGKPVVTTKIGGVEAFNEVIRIADTKEDFLKCLQTFLSSLKAGNVSREELRRAILPEHLWKTKADNMIDVIIKEFGAKNKRRGNGI